MTAIIPTATTVTAQNNRLVQPQSQVEVSAAITPMQVAELPDGLLKAVAYNDVYTNYKDNALTPKVVDAVGTSIPFIDSVARGALHDGKGSAKIARTANTGKDWGIFVGAVWLYNKALEQVYKAFPGARQFKQENPTITAIGEVGSAVAVGQGAIWGANKLYNKISPNKAFEQHVQEFVEKKFPKVSQKVGEVLKPVSEFAKNNKPVMKWAGFGVIATLGGLIVKYFYDVYNTREKADDKFEQLKDQRYEVVKAELEKTREAQAGEK